MNDKQEFHHRRITEILKGHHDAIEFCLMFFELTQIWDDLVDGDKDVPCGTISTAFKLALIQIPQNRFYVEHFHQLQPIIRLGILDWETANILEHLSMNDRVLAYVLRDSVGAVILECARIIGGDRYVEQIAYDVRTRLIHDEPFMTYFKSLRTGEMDDEP